MSPDAWITLAVVAVMLGILVLDLMPPAVTVLAATVTLLIVGVIDQGQAFAGFSNPAPLTVAALYVLARAAEKTGLLGPLVGRLLDDSGEVGRGTLTRLLAPTAATSAFINNTPLVAMLIPEITAWAERRDSQASRLLLPLSYAAILGGTLTVIGTSTNLVVSGLLDEAGMPPLSLFDTAVIGGPAAAAGLLTLIVLGPMLVPRRRGAAEDLTQAGREYVLEMRIVEGGRLDRKSVEDAGLRHLAGVYLVEIDRGGSTIAPVPPTTELVGGDRLTFVGRADLVVDLQRMRGLESSESEHLLEIDSPRHTFFEAVIGAESPLVGSTLRDAGFRGRYGAAVVAIHRAGQRVRAKLGEVRLRAGDTLLLLSDRDFRTRWGEGRDFLLVARLGGPPPSAGRKAPIVGAVTVIMVALAATGVVSILEAALLAAGALVATRTLTLGEARNAVDLDVVVLIASAFGIGAAMESTGLAGEIASGLVGALEPVGTVGIILGLVVATLLLTELITNNAAAVVVFPIAISVGLAADLDPRVLAIAIAVTASASFLTPLGYQTNTMVYGPGGYRFTDYLRVGMPISVVVVTAVTLTASQLA